MIARCLLLPAPEKFIMYKPKKCFFFMVLKNGFNYAGKSGGMKREQDLLDSQIF